MAAHSDEFRKGKPHLPVNTQEALTYSQHFANGGTLTNYLSDVKLAHNMSFLTVDWDKEALARMTRGARKVTLRQDKTIVIRKDLRRLTDLARQEGDPASAALYAVLAQFTLRAQSECFPLQSDGTHGLKMPSLAWHSKHREFSTKGRPSLALTVRKRKNLDAPSDITRHCICHTKGASICGVCLIKPYLRAGQPHDRIFPFGIPAATRHLRRRCALLEIPHGARMGWHSFRRGSASDMLADGDPISVILRSGGWKGPAALTYLARSELDKKLDLIRAVDASDSEPETQ
jgi:hypothetical protein